MAIHQAATPVHSEGARLPLQISHSRIQLATLYAGGSEIYGQGEKGERCIKWNSERCGYTACSPTADARYRRSI